jgi:hypothetical protein
VVLFRFQMSNDRRFSECNSQPSPAQFQVERRALGGIGKAWGSGAIASDVRSSTAVLVCRECVCGEILHIDDRA